MTSKTTNRRLDVRRILEEIGPHVTLQQITKKALEEGLWDQEAQDSFVFCAASAEVRNLLKRRDVSRLPNAATRHVSIDRDADGRIKEVKLQCQREFWTNRETREWQQGRAF